MGRRITNEFGDPCTRSSASERAQIWYWVVNFSRRGVHHYRRFYDPKHGGSDAARQAAIAWRDQKLAVAKVLSVLEFCQQKRSNNSSGVPAVHLLTPAVQPEGIWQRN